MKIKLGEISVHLIAWLFILMIPFLSSYQVIKSFAPLSNEFIYVPIIVLNLNVVVLFYLNYFLLIPKYLLTKKYVFYVSYFILCLGIAILFTFILFKVIGIGPIEAEIKDPVFFKISPIARANAILMLIASIVTSIALTFGNKIKQVEKEKISAELASLKSQINPHFLFNTLNSIYATAIDTSPQTADMVAKLSEMMRYTMKETQKEFVFLSDEIKYIDNYIELQKVRISKKIKLDFNKHVENTSLEIAPMLLIPFIENAFKYGVNSECDSHIEILLQLREYDLFLHVSNNKVNVQTDIHEKSGLGIENTKRRLELSYPHKHNLLIENNDSKYIVRLHIKLK